MVFSSIPFLYYFLPAVLGIYFLVPKGWKNAVLLLSSLFFSGWGAPKLLALMVFTIVLFFLCGLAIGVPNYMSARFLLLSLTTLPGVVVYPSFSVGVIIAVALVGVLCFREKLSRRKLIALGMILAALVLLNLKGGA